MNQTKTHLTYQNCLRKMKETMGDSSLESFLETNHLNDITEENAQRLKNKVDAIKEVHELWAFLDQEMGSTNFQDFVQFHSLNRDDGHYDSLLQQLKVQKRHLKRQFHRTRNAVGGKESYARLHQSVNPDVKSPLEIDKAIRIQYQVDRQKKRQQQVQAFVGGLDAYKRLSAKIVEEKDLDKKHQMMIQQHIETSLPLVKHQVKDLLEDKTHFQLLEQQFLDLLGNEPVVNRDFCELKYWQGFLSKD